MSTSPVGALASSVVGSPQIPAVRMWPSWAVRLLGVGDRGGLCEERADLGRLPVTGGCCYWQCCVGCGLPTTCPHSRLLLARELPVRLQGQPAPSPPLPCKSPRLHSIKTFSLTVPPAPLSADNLCVMLPIERTELPAGEGGSCFLKHPWAP